MQKSLSQPPEDQTKVIRMTKAWRMYYYAGALFFGLVGLTGAWGIVSLAAENLLEEWPKMPNLPNFLVMLLLILAFVLCIYWRAKNVRLVLSNTGLEYHDVGLNIFTTWDNIERIGKVRLGKALGIGLDCIVMRKPPEFRSSQWGALFYFLGGWHISLLEFGIHQSNKSELMLKQYAPRLFE